MEGDPIRSGGDNHAGLRWGQQGFIYVRGNTISPSPGSIRPSSRPDQSYLGDNLFGTDFPLISRFAPASGATSAARKPL